MSRTYRFLKAKDPINQLCLSAHYFIDWKLLYKETDINNPLGYRFHNYYNIDPYSKKGKKIIALIFSDKKHNVMIENGPSWFNRFNQKRHRVKANKEINKFKKTFISPIHCSFF